MSELERDEIAYAEANDVHFRYTPEGCAGPDDPGIVLRAQHVARPSDRARCAAYTLATKLVNKLIEAADEKVLSKTIALYGRVDLLCIDEL